MPSRIASRLKPENMRGFGVSVSALRRAYIDGTCVLDWDSSKIAQRSRNKPPGKPQKLRLRSTSPRLLRSRQKPRQRPMKQLRLGLKRTSISQASLERSQRFGLSRKPKLSMWVFSQAFHPRIHLLTRSIYVAGLELRLRILPIPRWSQPGILRNIPPKQAGNLKARRCC